MIATYVAPRKTTLTFEQARNALRWAVESRQTPAIQVEGLALCMAKTALETFRWTKMWNFNFGNVKAGESYVGMFTCITLNEVIGGKVVWFAPEGELTGLPGSPLKGAPLPVPDGHPQTRMRALPNEFAGAEHYIDFLATRYPTAYMCMVNGDPVRYVHELKRLGYFTANESEYLKGVVSLQREFIAKLKGLPHEDVPISDTLFADVERWQRLWFDAQLHQETQEPNT